MYEHSTTSQWAPPTPQYQSVNVCFQQCFQVETRITKYKGDYGLKTNTDSKIGISYAHNKEFGLLTDSLSVLWLFYMWMQVSLQLQRFTKINPQLYQEKFVLQ